MIKLGNKFKMQEVDITEKPIHFFKARGMSHMHKYVKKAANWIKIGRQIVTVDNIDKE